MIEIPVVYEGVDVILVVTKYDFEKAEPMSFYSPGYPESVEVVDAHVELGWSPDYWEPTHEERIVIHKIYNQNQIITDDIISENLDIIFDTIMDYHYESDSALRESNY